MESITTRDVALENKIAALRSRIVGLMGATLEARAELSRERARLKSECEGCARTAELEAECERLRGCDCPCDCDHCFRHEAKRAESAEILTGYLAAELARERETTATDELDAARAALAAGKS